MENKFNEDIVLFSPVGTSDPIRGFKDGPMLHIARVYRPCKIYIYLSSKMKKEQEKDDRFKKALKSIGYKDDRVVYIPSSSNNTNPADFEIYYDEFPKIYEKIRKENKDKEVLLNITSGTPQMNSFVYHSDIENAKHIQVLNPEKRDGTTDRTNKEDYDIDLEIKFNEDENENFEKRCIEATKNNATKFNIINSINLFLDEYEYNSSFDLIKSSNLFDNDVKDLLKVGCFKQDLNLIEGYKFANTKERFKKYYPFKCDDLYEYIINLQMKVDKENYLDFARGVTPIIDRLLEDYVKKIVKIDIGKFKTGDKIDYKKVYEDIKNEYFEQRGKTIQYPEYLNRYFLKSVIKAKGRDTENFINKFDNLDKFYKNIRNVSAHQIIYIDEKIINDKCGMRPDYVMKIIKEFYMEINKKATINDFKILNILNNDIKKYLTTNARK